MVKHHSTIGGINFTIINGKQLVSMHLFLSNSVFNVNTPYFFEPSTNKVFSTATSSLRELGGTKGTSIANRNDTIFTFVSRKFALSEITTSFANFVRNNSYSYHYVAPKLGPVTTPTRPGAAPSQRPTVANLSAKGSVIIGTIGAGGTISFAVSPQVHTNEHSWKTELARLANASPGTRYVAVEVVASVVAGGLVWS